jgi:hypothetical protein
MRSADGIENWFSRSLHLPPRILRDFSAETPRSCRKTPRFMSKTSLATFRRKIEVFGNSDTDGRCRQCRTKETTSPGAAGEVLRKNRIWIESDITTEIVWVLPDRC